MCSVTPKYFFCIVIFNFKFCINFCYFIFFRVRVFSFDADYYLCRCCSCFVIICFNNVRNKIKKFIKRFSEILSFWSIYYRCFFFQLVSLVSKNFSSNSYSNNFSFNSYFDWYGKLDSITDLEVYGQLLYTQFVLQVLIVGLILFLALVGVVFLTTKPLYQGVKSQTSFCQLSRSYLEQNPDQILL